MGRHLLALFLFIGLNFSCQKKINTEAPIEKYALTQDLMNKQLSYLQVPLTISLDDIQTQINKEFKGVIFEDSSFTNNSNDDLKLKIWKTKEIAVQPLAGDVFQFEIPLKIWAQKKISVLGFAQTPATNFEIVMKFSSKIFITADWKIQTNTTSLGYEWISKPKISVGLMEVPITSIIGNILNNQQPRIALLADQEITNHVEIKSKILSTWNELKKPWKASEEFNTWLMIEPQDILITPFKAEKREISTSIAIKAYISTISGELKSSNNASVSLPPLKFVENLPAGFNFFVNNLITYKQAEKIASELLINQIFEFKEGKYKVQIKEVVLYGTQNNRLVLQLLAAGSVNGTIYITGIPVYDDKRKEIVLTETAFDLKTKNVLLKVGSWIFEGNLLKQIENNFGIAVDPILSQAKQGVEKALNSKPMKGVNMSGKIDNVVPSKVFLSPEGLIAGVNASGNMKILIKGL